MKEKTPKSYLKPYYNAIDPDNYDPKEYGYVDAYINRLFLYENPNKLNGIKSERCKKEISEIDLSKITEEVKAIIYANLSYYKKLDYFIEKYPNLKGLRNVKPLKTPIKLRVKPRNLFKEYKDMNILV